MLEPSRVLINSLTFNMPVGCRLNEVIKSDTKMTIEEGTTHTRFRPHTKLNYNIGRHGYNCLDCIHLD